MGVPAEAGQQEVEVGQFGNPVLADIIACSVGQQGDGLSCWAHLEERSEAGEVGGREGRRERGAGTARKAVFTTHFSLNTVQKQNFLMRFPLHMCTPCQIGYLGRLPGSWSAPAAPGSCWTSCFGLGEAGS